MRLPNSLLSEFTVPADISAGSNVSLVCSYLEWESVYYYRYFGYYYTADIKASSSPVYRTVASMRTTPEDMTSQRFDSINFIRPSNLGFSVISYMKKRMWFDWHSLLCAQQKRLYHWQVTYARDLVLVRFHI